MQQSGVETSEVSTKLPMDIKSSSDNKKLEFLQNIFNDVNENDVVLIDFPGSLQLEVVVQGHLYLTLHGLYFHSNIFGFISTARFNWEEVVSIKRENAAYFLPISIQIVTNDNKYFFSFMSNRDRIFSAIVKTCKNAASKKFEALEPLIKFVTQSINQDSPKNQNKDEIIELEDYDRSEEVSNRNNDEKFDLKKDVISESSNKTEVIDADPNLNPKKLLTSMSSSSSEMSRKDATSQKRCECHCCENDSKEIFSKNFNTSPSLLRFLIFSEDSPVLKPFSESMKLQNVTIKNEPSDKDGCDVKTISYLLPMGFPFPLVNTQTTQKFYPSGSWDNESHCCVCANSTSQNVAYSDSFLAVVTYCFTSQSPTTTSLKVYLRISFIKSVSLLMKGIIMSRSFSKTEEFVKNLMKVVSANISPSSLVCLSEPNLKLIEDNDESVNSILSTLSTQFCSSELMNSLVEAQKVVTRTVKKVSENISRPVVELIIVILFIILMINQIFLYNKLAGIISEQQNRIDRLVTVIENSIPVAEQYFTRCINDGKKCIGSQTNLP